MDLPVTRLAQLYTGHYGGGRGLIANSLREIKRIITQTLLLVFWFKEGKELSVTKDSLTLRNISA